MIDVLRRIPVEWITSPELTGDMEASLLAVQRGEETMEAYMEKIIQQTKSMVDRIRDHDRNTLYLEEPSLGSCPSCGGEVKENTLAYQCEHNEGRDKGCSFVFWKDTSGRWFDRITAARLIENGSLENLHGFYSQAGEGYDTSVELTKTGKVVSKGSGSGEATADDEVLCPCPVCDQGSIRITTTAYLCDNPDCTFRGMQNIMCKRPITPEEAKPIFTDGKSTLLEDFTSRRNKPFNAFLKLEKNRVTYDFPPRAAAADAKRFPVVPGVVAVCPKTKANIVETETHYTTEDSSTDCKIHLERCISKRDITREEAKTLIETGSVGPFDDFISKKTNNPFSASLYLKRISPSGTSSQNALERLRTGRKIETIPSPSQKHGPVGLRRRHRRRRTRRWACSHPPQPGRITRPHGGRTRGSRSTVSVCRIGHAKCDGRGGRLPYRP